MYLPISFCNYSTSIHLECIQENIYQYSFQGAADMVYGSFPMTGEHLQFPGN